MGEKSEGPTSQPRAQFAASRMSQRRNSGAAKSRSRPRFAPIAQSIERVPPKDEAPGEIPGGGTR